MEMDSLVGFRFKPTNEEIICLLKEKRLNPEFSVHTVKEIDFYRFDPWELPTYSEIQSKESIWYFYCKPHNFKNSNTSKERKTKSGTWKINGTGSPMKAKTTKVVIGRKTFLSFQRGGAISKKAKAKKAKVGAIVKKAKAKKAKAGAIVKKAKAKKAKAEWVMHEIHVEDDPLYKDDVVVCRLEQKRVSKRRISTSDENESSHLDVAENTSLKFVLQPNQQVVYDRNHVAEKTSLLLSHNLQVLQDQHLVFDSRNHAAEKIFSGFEDQPSSLYLTLDYSNHAAEKIFSGFEDQPPSQYLTWDYSNPAAEKTLPTMECELLPSHFFNSTSDYINHLAENIFQMDESQQLPSHHLISDFSGLAAEHSFPVGSNDLNYNSLPSLPALQSPIDGEEDGFSGCNVLDHNSFSAQQCPFNPEQRTSSYFDGFSDCNVSSVVLQGKPMLFAQFDALQGSNGLNYNSLPSLPALQSPIDGEEDGFSGCNVLDHNSFSAQQCPFNPEQRTSSYFDGFSDCNVSSVVLQGEPMLFAQFDALQGSNSLNYNALPALQSPIDVEEDGFSGWNGLDHNSFPSQQCPINPEQRTSSYFDGFTDCNVPNFQFDNQ